MKLSRGLAVGLSALLVLQATAGTAEARNTYRPEDKAKSAKTEEVAKYPQATRTPADSKISDRLVKVVQRMIDQFNEDKFDAAIASADEILGNDKAKPADRARAAQIAAYAWLNSDAEGSYPKAMAYMQQALDSDALPNNDHYDMMYNLAQAQMGEEQYDAALATLDRFIKETGQAKPEALALKGNTLYRLDRFAEAAEALKAAIAAAPEPQASWTQLLMASYFDMDQPAEAAKLAEQMLAKSPNDKKMLLNLTSIYLQADQPEKAGAVFDRLRAQGLLTESKDYETGYRLLGNIDGREQDAIALINEGLGKGVLTPSFEVYNYLGQSYYFSDQVGPAIEAWGKAAPMAKDGETYLNLAKVLVIEERWAEGKAAAQQGLAKGVKKPGDAWMTIARAEYGDEGTNKAAVLAAYREAAKYPETRAQAEKQIQQLSR